MKQQFDVEATLERGGGGIFDVFADGTRIYSKHQTGRFPEHDEIKAAINSHL